MGTERTSAPVAELEKSLGMDHLRDFGAVVKAAEESVLPDARKPKDPRTEREYTFDLKWKSGSGETFSGKFVSKIMTLNERGLVGILRARLSGNTPYEAMDEFTRELHFLVATLTYALKERPDWAKDLMALDDIALLHAIYEEVSQHEDTFRGRKAVEVGGKKGA